jgi:two-component system chemotaxis response regulator CheB
MIRVLVVDDSSFVTEVLSGVLGADPEIVVAGSARNGLEALDLTRRLKPDVITMDLRMPVMNGVQATAAIMAECPTPILVVSATPHDGDDAFDAIRAGAMEVVQKPREDFSRDYVAMGTELIRLVKLLSKVPPVRRPLRSSHPLSELALPERQVTGNVVAMAASTGGPGAYCAVLGRLPAAFPWPILAVQHIVQGFLDGFVRWLDGHSELRVVTAEHGAWPRPGHVYFPSEDHHLAVDATGRLVLDPSAPVDGHRPSATYLFRSVAQAYGARAVGVVMTGMGQDGAKGLLDLRHAGGHTIAQDEASSVVYGMPQSAVELGAAESVVSLERIPEAILAVAGRSPTASRRLSRGAS